MIVVGALQPVPKAMEDRFSQRAIEVTLERPAPPPALPVAMTETDNDDIRRGTPPDSAPGALASVLPLFDSVHRTKLEEAVMPSHPAPAVSARELARAAPNAAARPPDATDPAPQRPAQHKAIKPPTSAASASANQRQALQDYVLQVVAKLSHTRFYALSQGARNGDGVVVARLTVARDGGLVDLSLPKQSGSAGVDSSVLDAIRQAAPFAPLPKGFADSRFTFIVPINYAPER
jgi:protein TonB